MVESHPSTSAEDVVAFGWVRLAQQFKIACLSLFHQTRMPRLKPGRWRAAKILRGTPNENFVGKDEWSQCDDEVIEFWSAPQHQDVAPLRHREKECRRDSNTSSPRRHLGSESQEVSFQWDQWLDNAWQWITRNPYFLCDAMFLWENFNRRSVKHSLYTPYELKLDLRERYEGNNHSRRGMLPF